MRSLKPMPSELVTAINRLADEVKRYNDRIDPKRVKGVEFGKAQYGDIEERETGEALQVCVFSLLSCISG